MRHRQYTVTRQDVHGRALSLLTAHLRLPDFSRRCPAEVVLSVVLLAAARLCSVFAAARRLLAVPSAETIRQALAAALPGREELERRLNRALAADLPRSLVGTRQPLACDLTLRPYHGRPFARADEVYRSKAKSGTSHFHAYATCYLVRHGRRFTLALTWVRRGEALEDVLWRLLRQARRVGVRPEYLLLDRGFCSVAVIRYLQAGRYPFLMPLPARGRRADHPDGPSGSRVFAYARRRFGIETSYRQMNQAKVTTCTRNPLVRLFLVGVALILRNVWVWLHWQLLSTPRRGGRALRLERLRFKELLLWVQHVIEEEFGVWDAIAAERPPSQPLAA